MPRLPSDKIPAYDNHTPLLLGGSREGTRHGIPMSLHRVKLPLRTGDGDAPKMEDETYLRTSLGTGAAALHLFVIEGMSHTEALRRLFHLAEIGAGREG